MKLSLLKFVKDESGQTTTEYILILAVIVTIFMQFRNKLTSVLKKLFEGIDNSAGEVLENDGEW